MPVLTGGARTRTRVPAEERRCAPVARRTLQGLACLGDGRAYAEQHDVEGETAMPFYDKGDVRIYYEEVGSGFPLMVIPGGGLNSTVAGLATHPFNPMEEFQDEFRVITADLRNAKGGQSMGPLEVDRPWDAYTDDQVGLMDPLGIRDFMVLGFCIGGPFIWNLLQRASDRVVAAVLAQPSGYRPEIPDLSYTNNMQGWGPELCTRRPDMGFIQNNGHATNGHSRLAPYVEWSFPHHAPESCPPPVVISVAWSRS